MTNWQGFLAGVATTVVVAGVWAQDKKPDLAFETGREGDAPSGWFVPTPGYAATLSADKPKEGKLCARLAPNGRPDGTSPFGNLMTGIDATPYREKRIRFRAAVKIESTAGGHAQLWLREDCEGEKMGFFENMGERPITTDRWEYFEIVGDIGKNAKSLALGMMAFGPATCWLDDVTIEAIGDAKTAVAEPARPLAARGAENIVALTRLIGYVRYFHPSDESEKADWPEFTIRAMREIEPAASPAELSDKLTTLFSPIAPTARVFALDKRPAMEGAPPPKPDQGAVRVTQWRHKGVGFSRSIMPGMYSSTRTRGFVNDAKLPDGFADPAQPYFAHLGGGVGCYVPLSLYLDADGATLPHRADETAGKTDGGRSDSTAPARYTGDDRATRLADVALAWNVFQHFYPYFDVVKTDWKSVLPQALRRAAEDKDETAFLDTLRWLVAQLHDGHGNVYGPGSEMASPPILLAWVENKLVVTQVGAAVTDASPLLKPGAIIQKIDDQPAEKAIADAESLISAATPQWKRYRALTTLLSGPANVPVTLEIADASGKSESVRLTRSGGLAQLREPRPAMIAEIKPGVWYVDMDRLTDGALTDETLEKLASAKGVIFEMRGYPAGGEAWKVLPHVTDETIFSAQWHVPIQTRPDQTDLKFDSSNWPVIPAEPRFKGKIAFLTDGRAISAAETLMGMVENYKLGEIVGGPTAGTNGNVNPFTLPGGYHVAWTGMQVLKHDGSQHHGVGIRPTVPVERTIAGIAAGRDEVLEKAIEIVSK